MKNKGLIIITLVVIGIAFWGLNFLTPEYLDDYSYKFMAMRDKVSFNCNSPITSLKDVLISQYNHYFSYNGRSIVHIIVQLFTGIWGKHTFNLINTLVFVVFVSIITRLYTKITTANLLFSCCIIFLLYPISKQTILWMTGSVNYMWTSTLTCMFLWVIEKYKKDQLDKKHFVWSIPCFFVGWTHEGITFPLSLSLIIYIAIYYKTIYKQAPFPLILCFIIGSLLCSFAPGIMYRASQSNYIEISNIGTSFISNIVFCVQLKAFNILLCTMVILFFMKHKSFSWIKDFYKKNIIIYNALFFSFGIIFSLGQTHILRAATGIELFSIILLLRIIQYHHIYVSQKIKTLIYATSCFLYCIVLYYSVANYQEYKYILSQIKQQKNDIIKINKIHLPYYIESYILEPLDDTTGDTPECLFYNKFWNKCISKAYHHDSLAFIPTVIYNDIINHSDKINDFQKQKDYPFYVFPSNNMIDSITPKFILKPTNYQNLPFYFRPFASKMQRYSATEIPANKSLCGMININGQTYFLVGRNMMIDDRVQTISLK